MSPEWASLRDASLVPVQEGKKHLQKRNEVFVIPGILLGFSGLHEGAANSPGFRSRYAPKWLLIKQLKLTFVDNFNSFEPFFVVIFIKNNDSIKLNLMLKSG